jgi:predicted MPP superfamily phosphohydrolase
MGVTAASAFGFGGYALAEPWRNALTQYQISPPRWPKGLKLRLAVIADLHVCEPWMGIARVEGIVERANATGADCILLLGDYVSGLRLSRIADPIPHAKWANALKRLSAPHGVYSVLGNHDWWEDLEAARYGRLPRAGLALEDAGVAVLHNRGVRLQKDGAAFWIAGLGDQWAFMTTSSRWREERGVQVGADDLGGMLGQLSDDAPAIVLAHEPDVFAEMPDRVALTVSGHTHGGQVRILGYAPYVPSRYGSRYVYGHIVEEGRNLVVSGGLGCSVMPIRFGSPPEIVVIDLAA